MTRGTSRKELDTRFDALFREQQAWVPNWKDIQAYILPRRGKFAPYKPNDGRRFDQKIVDSAPIFAIRILASGIMAGLTSPSRPWFRLMLPDPELSEFESVRWWLDSCQKWMLHGFQRDKFYKAAYPVYEEIAGFGTGCMGMFEAMHLNQIAKYQAFTCGTYALGVNSDGLTDTFARKLSYTAKQMVNEFGIDNVSADVKRAYEKQRTEEYFEVFHLIEPNDTRIEGLAGVNGMPYRSIYWDPSQRGGLGKDFLAVRGFHEFPIMAPRWDTTESTDCYGKGPGWDVLGDSKMLQELAKDGLVGLKKEINPPMLAPAAMRTSGVSIIPGGMTYYGDARIGQNDQIRPLMTVKPNLGDLRVWVQDIEAKIHKGLYADLFLMFAETDRREITAAEVYERHEEKLLALGPLLENLETELLKPVIERKFAMMYRADALPPAPPEVEGMELQVEFTSVLAQAQKMTGTSAIRQLVLFAGEAGQFNPEAIQKVNFAEAVDQMGNMLGVAPGIVRSDEEFDSIIQAQRQRDAMANQAAIAQTAADSAQKLSNSNLEGDNILTRMLEGGQAGGMTGG